MTSRSASHDAPGAGSLHVDLSLVRGTFRLDARVTAAPGEVLGIIGPNGAGKSSLVGAIAGKHRITGGEVRLGDRILARHDAGSPVHIARAERDIGHLDQRARLFPHLTARENVAFGPRARGIPREHAHAHADAWLERVGVAGRGGDRPHAFSGGQQQRIAIARALAADPTAVLLDEPFAALDIESAVGIRALVLHELRRIRVPVVLVTHDPVDLLTLADRVAVIEAGTVQQIGDVDEVLGYPATPFTAHFAGRVLIEGVVSAQSALQLENAPMLEIRGTGSLPGVGTVARATYDPLTLRVVPVQDALESNAEPPRHHDGSHRWVDRIAHLTPTHSGLRVSGERWPHFTADVPLTTAIADHLHEGLLVEFQLDEGDVRFAAPHL